MTPEEMEKEAWDDINPPVVLVLDNGAKIFASKDQEGNSSGVIFIQTKTKNYALL